MNEDNSKVIEDLVPKVLSLAVVQKVLQNPLRERVSIRDAVSIVEALGEAAPITEYVRPAIRRQVVKPLLEPSGDLSAYFLDAALDQSVESAVEHTENSGHVNLSWQRKRDIQERLKKCCNQQDARSSLLSHNEIPPGIGPALSEVCLKKRNDGLRAVRP